MLTCFYPFSLLDFDFVPFFCSISFVLDLTLLFVYVFFVDLGSRSQHFYCKYSHFVVSYTLIRFKSICK
uniref:Putative ovule protein n=1 Tax=Solanum chacoense TaxID=4108 RepID=A0A0V0I7L1_SOLCH